MPTAEIILDGTIAHQVNYVFSQCSLMAVLHLLSAKLYNPLSHSYQKMCNLIGYEDVNIRRICARSEIWQYRTAVQIWEKNSKMADSQGLPENQLKRHVLVWVTATFLIKWKVDLGNLPADSETITHCIDLAWNSN